MKQADAPQKCRKCGGIHFTEEALQNTTQSGVMIVDGEPDYSDAATVDLGDVDRVKLYTCDNPDCGAEHVLRNGRLVAPPRIKPKKNAKTR